MKQPPTIYSSGLVTRTMSRRVACADCGRDLGVQHTTRTGLASLVASGLAQWLREPARCRACLRKVVRGA